MIMKIQGKILLVTIHFLLVNEGITMKRKNGTKLETLLEYAGCSNDGFYLGQGICLEADYSKGDAPNQTETAVHYWFKYIRVRDISDGQKTLAFEYMLSLIWFDHRIKTNFSNHMEEKDIRQSLASQRIWKPMPNIKRITDKKDLTDSIDVKKFSFSSKDTNNTDAIKVHLKFSGRMTVFCNDWKLEKYPLDRQTCPIEFYHPGPSAVNYIIDPQNKSDLFVNTWHIAAGFDIMINFVDSSKNNAIKINIQMQRLFQPFFFKFYLPSILIVCISGTGFLFPLTVLPGRMTLAVTQFLTLANLFIYQMVIYFHDLYIGCVHRL